MRLRISYVWSSSSGFERQTTCGSECWAESVNRQQREIRARIYKHKNSKAGWWSSLLHIVELSAKLAASGLSHVAARWLGGVLRRLWSRRDEVRRRLRSLECRWQRLCRFSFCRAFDVFNSMRRPAEPSSEHHGHHLHHYPILQCVHARGGFPWTGHFGWSSTSTGTNIGLCAMRAHPAQTAIEWTHVTASVGREWVTLRVVRTTTPSTCKNPCFLGDRGDACKGSGSARTAEQQCLKFEYATVSKKPSG